MQTDEGNFTDWMLIPSSNLMKEISLIQKASRKFVTPLHTSSFISYLIQPAFLSWEWKLPSLIFTFLELFDFE